MSSSPEYIKKLVTFLNQESSWNKSIIADITRFLNIASPTSADVDSLLMEVTKKVEIELRKTLAQHIGNTVPHSRSFGQRLLDYAVVSHLIANKDESIYSLLKLIIKGPRNTSHHNFTAYPYKTVVMFLTEANEAIDAINSLLKSTYTSLLRTNYDQTTKKVKIQANIFRPDTTILPPDQKVEAILTFPQDRIKTIPLTMGSSNLWYGQYDVRGENCGTVTCFLRGFDNTSSFVASSGSSLIVSYARGEKCPNCNSEITSSFISICSRCGTPLPIV